MERLSKGAKTGLILYTLCIYASMWLQASVHSAIGTYQSRMIDTFLLTESQKGLPSSALSLFTIITFVVVMFLTGRVKKAYILTFGLLLGGASLLLIKALNTESFLLFLFLLALTGIALGTIDSLSSAVISELYPGNGALMCLLHATYGLAGLVMPFAFKLITDEKPYVNGVFSPGGWRSAFGSVGASMLLLFVFLLIIVLRRSSEIEKTPSPSEMISVKTVREVIVTKALIPLFVSSILGGMYLNTMLVWSPRFIEFGHMSVKYRDFALPCVYLALTSSRLLMSFVKPDMTLTLKRLMPFSALFLLAATLVKNPLAALILTLISVFCYGPVIPFQLTIAGEMLPEKRLIVTIGLMFVMMLGQTLIAPIIGAAESEWGINSALVLAAVSVLLSWLSAMFIKKNDLKA